MKYFIDRHKFNISLALLLISIASLIYTLISINFQNIHDPTILIVGNDGYKNDDNKVITSTIEAKDKIMVHSKSEKYYTSSIITNNNVYVKYYFVDTEYKLSDDNITEITIKLTNEGINHSIVLAYKRDSSKFVTRFGPYINIVNAEQALRILKQYDSGAFMSVHSK